MNAADAVEDINPKDYVMDLPVHYVCCWMTPHAVCLYFARDDEGATCWSRNKKAAIRFKTKDAALQQFNAFMSYNSLVAEPVIER